VHNCEFLNTTDRAVRATARRPAAVIILWLPSWRATLWTCACDTIKGKGKGCPYSITERRVPELIPVLGSQPAGDVSH